MSVRFLLRRCVRSGGALPVQACKAMKRSFAQRRAGSVAHLSHGGRRRAQDRHTVRNNVACASSQSEKVDGMVDAGWNPEDQPTTSEPRDDDVLPESLMDSINQSAQATHDAIKRGCRRANVEILLPEFWDPISGALFANQGDQMRWWKLCRRFAEDMMAQTGAQKTRVLFPDIGVAAYLQNNWEDVAFSMKSLKDKEPLDGDEDLVIAASPDPTNASDCVRLNQLVPEDVPLALFNARLVSGDVGIGLNVRRMRQQFLGQFIITYSIRPIGDEGTVFRRYPAEWKVFLEDESEPGRYKLVAERPERPQGDVLDRIVMTAGKGQTADNGEEQGGGLLQSVASSVNSMGKFMQSLTK